MMPILEIQQLKKQFGSQEVLKGINLLAEDHSLIGFIGQNGAGKTTTMKCILGLLPIDDGSIRVCGEPVTFGNTKVNRHIGYLSDVPAFYDYLSPMEYLQLCGAISNASKAMIVKRSEELLKLTGLWESRKKRIASFSRGMKQRLGIAQALLNEPKLLIADEPTSALDPMGRKEILDILTQIKSHTTVLFSTHILSDVERVCDTYAVLHKGVIQLQGSMHAIHEKGSDTMAIEFMHPLDAQRFKAITRLTIQPESDTHIFVRYSDIKQLQNILYEELKQHAISIRRMELVEPTLESIYMEVVK